MFIALAGGRHAARDALADGHADLPHLESLGDLRPQLLPLLVHHEQRRAVGVQQARGLVHDDLQQPREVELAAERLDGIEQLGHLARIGGGAAAPRSASLGCPRSPRRLSVQPSLAQPGVRPGPARGGRPGAARRRCRQPWRRRSATRRSSRTLTASTPANSSCEAGEQVGTRRAPPRAGLTPSPSPARSRRGEYTQSGQPVGERGRRRTRRRRPYIRRPPLIESSAPVM